MSRAFRVLVAVVVCSLASPLVARENGRGQDTVHQVSTLAALLEGDYDGRTTFHELGSLGGFGLGTFDRLDGEMIAVDGRFYRVRVDGRATRVHPRETTPFAAVTSFRPDDAFRLEGPVSCSALTEVIRARFDSDELPQAVKITGEFSELVTRSVPAQVEPYVPLADALKEQVVFDFYYVEARMVGFWIPPILGEVNVGGFHFHALTNDNTAGGHVLDCEALNVKVEIDTADSLDIRLGTSVRKGDGSRRGRRSD